MNALDRIDAAAQRWNVLDHPFYTRWSAGELTRAELAEYSAQYRHAVVALAHTAAICSSGWSLSIDHAFLSLSPRVLFLAASGATTAPDAIRPGPTTRNVGDNLETRIT